MNRTLRLGKEGLWAMVSIKNFPTYFAVRFKRAHGEKIYLKFWNGVRFAVRTATPEPTIVEEIWHQRIYDPLADRIKDGSTVVDIGGNIGVFSVKAALAAKNVKVFAYEPVPENVAMLRENIALNHCEDRVKVHELGVAGSAGEKIFFTQEHDSGGGSLQSYHGHVHETKIRCTTLADIFRDEKIEYCDFMKIDCEGAEEDILFNTPPELFQRIESMTIEWHDILSKLPIEEFEAFLRKMGYTVYHPAGMPLVYAHRDGSRK